MGLSISNQINFTTNNQTTTWTLYGRKFRHCIEIDRTNTIDGNLAYAGQYFPGGTWLTIPGSPATQAEGDQIIEFTGLYYAIRYNLTGFTALAGRSIKITQKSYNEHDEDAVPFGGQTTYTSYKDTTS